MNEKCLRIYGKWSSQAVEHCQSSDVNKKEKVYYSLAVRVYHPFEKKHGDLRPEQ